MPNGRYWLNDLELESRMKEMSDRELLEFTARQSYEVCIVAQDNRKRVEKLEGKNNKMFGVSSGAGTIIGAAIVTVINYFMRR